MRKKHYVIIASLIGFLWCHDGLCASDRIALVIGNKDYQDAPLKNPINDANDLSEALGRLGFDVIKKINLTHQEMERSLREFGQRVEPGGVALFYFSGHGVQIDGTNYLLPVGQTIYGPEEIKYKSVQAGFVLSKMESAGSKVNIVILDACRNNPSKGFRSLNEGLAAMDTRGAFIAYSTAPGSVASDNLMGRNGLYTEKLLKTLETPGLTIEELFRRVSYQVGRESDKKQIPWTASGLYGEKPFYFIPPDSSNPQKNSNKDNSDTAEKIKIGKYIDNRDGTIKDAETGLMWKRCSEGLSGENCEKGEVRKYSWNDAVQRFKNVEYAGYTDWRLPTIDELTALLYCNKGSNDYQKVNQQIFPNTDQVPHYWSRTPASDDTRFAWGVKFICHYDGISIGKEGKITVRLVRGGHSSNPQKNSNKDNLETAGISNECSKMGTASGEMSAELFCSVSEVIGSSAEFAGMTDNPDIACGEAYRISCESSFVRKAREKCPQYAKGKNFDTYYRASKGGCCSYSN
ncbi:MAG: caspase family protein [Candidatus Electrothrix communis]|nr:MAG: caspase family protein [Candidatus Electrothrix communis]